MIHIIYGMHPTVLHEDSRLVSSDFFHFTRQHIGALVPPGPPLPARRSSCQVE
jgi:hypothetical protein